MNTLLIDKYKCTQCNICVESCPVLIIEMNPESQLPQFKDNANSRCIECFHCQAICPTEALQHSACEEFPITKSDLKTSVTADALGSYMKERRSIRQFKSQNIEQQTLEKAFEIIRYSPTGTNRQFNEWIIVLSSSKVQQLAEATIEWMKAVDHQNPEMSARYSFPALINAWNNGLDLICRNAPHLAICLTPANHPIGLKDATIALAHLELYLPSMGIGCCWAGYFMIAAQQSPTIKQLLGINDDVIVHGALMLGYPKYKYSRIPERKKVTTTWVY